MKKRLIAVALAALVQTIALAQLPEVIKAAWVTNVGSQVLMSRANIKEAVQLAKRSGLNTLCVVTWNKGYTQYPSSTMKQYFGTAIDPLYAGRDPLQEMIEEAHQEGIKVVAWFEFGFAASYGSAGKHILEKYPQWAAIDEKDSALVENGFAWMNSFHPEVQQFVRSLVLEVVERYDVDGVQGDDRLPAAPIRGGYDAYTRQAFAAAHGGQQPPRDVLNAEWMNWRAGLMNTFGKDLYKRIKQIKPNMVVAHAPSIYPWSKEHYLQDWPTWLNEGYTDIVMPQVYRYNAEAYRKTLDAVVEQVGPKHLHQVFPGMLTSLADGYQVSDSLLQECIAYNRSKGIKGEVFFYFEGIRRSPEFYRRIYSKLP